MEACSVCGDEAGERGSTHLILDSKGCSVGYGGCSGYASAGCLHSGPSVREEHCRVEGANAHVGFRGGKAHPYDDYAVSAGRARSGDHAGGVGYAGGFDHAGASFDFALRDGTSVYAGRTVVRHGTEVSDEMCVCLVQ